MADRWQILNEAIGFSLAMPLEEIDSAATFLGLGGDSLTAVMVSEELASAGLELDPLILFDDIPIGELAKYLQESLPSEG